LGVAADRASGHEVDGPAGPQLRPRRERPEKAVLMHDRDIKFTEQRRVIDEDAGSRPKTSVLRDSRRRSINAGRAAATTR
jgi:hypothetical protein